MGHSNAHVSNGKQVHPPRQQVNEVIDGEDFQRDGDAKTALEIFKLVEIAYPQSADVQSDLADAHLANGEKDLAREHAQRDLSLLDSHAAPASSWSDTEERRGEIRKAAEETLKKASGKQ